MHPLRALAVLALLLPLAGCVRNRCCPPSAWQCAPAARVVTPVEPPTRAAAPAFTVYDGVTGKPADFQAALASWKDADLVVFGELHGNPVGAAKELEILTTMAEQGRPVALAMEFLERDTQAAVDAYLAGSLAEEDFVKQARQSKAYATSHRPLIEYCKAHGIPVIAANAPRKHVSAYRKSTDDYATFLEGLPEEERAFLPEETTELEDEYRDRFLKLMGPERGPAYFRSQSLWDDAMAEAMVDFREEHPAYRIFFIVGAFHVQSGEGTITKYRMRRGKDEVRLVVMALDNEHHLPFDEEEAGTGDVVINVPAPQMVERPKGPNPHEKKATSPHETPKKAGGAS